VASLIVYVPPEHFPHRVNEFLSKLRLLVSGMHIRLSLRDESLDQTTDYSFGFD
jgi:hypothetical protein